MNGERSAITVRNLGKRYTLGAIGATTFREDLARWWNRARHRPNGQERRSGDILWALRDVSFDVKRGASLGIIGRNGAGKSTLLKILSRITTPTTGEARLRGRVASLLEVGTGFHPELTGRENAFLNGAVLGMRRAEVARKFDAIVDFAGIERFIDTPVKRYSSGMYVRLAFAVAAHLEPDILVVDEVLAVGDHEFQRKCLGRMEAAAAHEGRTVLFVSHNMGAIHELCPQSVLLDQGRVVRSGDTPSVVAEYLRGAATHASVGDVVFGENLSREMQLRRLRLLDHRGCPAATFDCDQPVAIELTLDVRRRLPGLYAYLEISRIDGTRVMMSDSFDSGPNPLDNLGEGTRVVRVTIPARTLGAGEYSVYLNFTSLAADHFNVDSPGNICTFRLEDLTSKRGNQRPGYFSTLLDWEVVAQ